MATSEQLEREAEATRARIAASLDELRGRMTPGQIVDQVMDYARDSGGGEFFRNLGRQVVDNPIPVTLVGTGLAWLMMANRNGAAAATTDGAGAMGERLRDRASTARDEASAAIADFNGQAAGTAQEWGAQARQTAGRLNESVGETAGDLQERASAAASAMRDTAGDLQERAGAAASAIRDTAASAYQSAADRSRQGADAMSRGARAMSDNLAASGRNLVGFLQEQPLVLAGIGLALGAMLGTSLPGTNLENQIMGDASEATKGEAKGFAEAELEKGKAAAGQAWSAAKPEIEKQLGGQPDQSRAASASEPVAPGAPGASSVEATLVPSDDTANTAGNDGARETEQHSG